MYVENGRGRVLREEGGDGEWCDENNIVLIIIYFVRSQLPFEFIMSSLHVACCGEEYSGTLFHIQYIVVD